MRRLPFVNANCRCAIRHEVAARPQPSPKVAGPLRAAGHDVTVAREVGLSTASDEVVIATARLERRVLVSADTDFGRSRGGTAGHQPIMVMTCPGSVRPGTS